MFFSFYVMPISSKESVISHLVYSSSGKDVETVIVDGKVIMKNRNVLTLDEEKIYSDVDKLTSNLLA